MDKQSSPMALKRRASFTQVMQQVPERFLQRSKSIKVEEFDLTIWGVHGVQRSLADDFAHICLEMHWARLLLFILTVYGGFSILFACVFYNLDGIDGIGGDIPPDMQAFEVCLWFSTVNLVTAGFGSLVPVDRTAYVVSTLAHFTGLLLNALLLGVVVAKASLPTAKMVFSNVVCVRTRNNIQHLMVRVGNARGNILYSPDIRFAYIRAVTTEEGETYFEDTLLQVKVPAALKPVFMITHAVTHDSPLNSKSEQDIIKEKGFFVLIVSATDVETGQSLYARRLFFMKDFRFNHQFIDVITESAGAAQTFKAGSAEALEGAIRQMKMIDFLKFHETAPLQAVCWKEGSQICKPSRTFGQLQDAEAGSLQDSEASLKPISRLEMKRHAVNNDAGLPPYSSFANSEPLLEEDASSTARPSTVMTEMQQSKDGQENIAAGRSSRFGDRAACSLTGSGDTQHWSASETLSDQDRAQSNAAQWKEQQPSAESGTEVMRASFDFWSKAIEMS